MPDSKRKLTLQNTETRNDGSPLQFASGRYITRGAPRLESARKWGRRKFICQSIRIGASMTALNCGEVQIEHIRFLGTRMWTDFRLFGDGDRKAAMREAEAVMTDYKHIRLAKNGYRKLRAVGIAEFHAMQKSCFKKKLAERFSGRTVVITHMAPSMLSVTDRYATDPVSAAYASRLDEMVSDAHLWVHGHMHNSFDYRIGKCRVVCNPCGYMTRDGGTENPGFDPHFIVEI